MPTMLKWILPPIFVVLLVISIGYASSQQNITTNTTSEVDVLAESVSVGMIRGNLNEQGSTNQNVEYVNKDQLVSNLVANVEKVQKQHNYDIKLTYAFLDKNNNVANDENVIRGIEFRLQLVDPKTNKVKGTAARRLSLNQLTS